MHVNERLKKFANKAAEVTVSMTRTNYFDSKERGEVHELKAELNSDMNVVRKEAVRKVIAAMTVGKDVSTLFPDILRCMQTNDLEIKKLVYLYLVNHAQGQPDMALLAVNSLVKDSEHLNPMIRALALRTIGSLNLPLIVDYLDEPLRRAVADEHALVRKTAALCIGKMFEVTREASFELQLDRVLMAMLNEDEDAQVMANALAVIQQVSISPQVSIALIARLTIALESVDEWGAVSILSFLVSQRSSLEESTVICQRVIPQLAHSNASVVMAAIQVLIAHVHEYSQIWNDLSIHSRLSTTFTTLLTHNANHEMQFIVCKCLLAIKKIFLLAVPIISVHNEDPLYLKSAKLQIMVSMTDQNSAGRVLSDLIEYAKDVDVCFAEQSVQCICDLHRVIPSSTPAIIQTLMDLTQTGVVHLVQKALHCLRQILSTTDAIPSFGHLLQLAPPEDPQARASLIWLVGHCVDHDLSGYMRSFEFPMESVIVQSQLLTTGMHMYVKGCCEKEYVMELIGHAQKSAESMDLRDRARVYQRLLQFDPLIVPSLPQIPRTSGLIDSYPGWLPEQIGLISSIVDRPVCATSIRESIEALSVDSTHDYMTEYTV